MECITPWRRRACSLVAGAHGARRQRPRASVLVDVYADDWSRLAWVQALGEVTILEPGMAEAEAGLAALCTRYAPYRGRSPVGPLLRLDVERALCWRAADYEE